MSKLVKVGMALGAIALIVGAAAVAKPSKSTAGGTFVFAGSADPVTLDAALTSDGESYRAQVQLIEGFVGLRPGSNAIRPLLATKWKTTNGGKTWTFTLRKNVKFHDGTPFNAKAACFNFDRWYNFRGALQSDAASYYYNVVFGGFAHPEKGAPGPGKALYKNCKAVGQNTAVINLKRRFGAFIPALTLPQFGFQSPTSMTKYGADKGHLDKDGVYHPDGTYGVEQVAGTGPFKFESWKIGDKLVLARNDSYWGRKAYLDKVILVAISEGSARLQALQTGEIMGYDNVDPQDIRTVRKSSKLKIADRPPFNVGYVGINQAIAPFDDVRVRKAVAYGLDKKKVVGSLYLGRGKVATQFTAPGTAGYSNNPPTYPYSPAKAKALLKAAGLTLPVEVEFWYPTNVSRPYMPQPARNFQAFAASLNKSGFKVVAKSAPWNPDYLGRTAAGTAGALYFLGWTGDYGHPSTFLDSILRADLQFGLQDGRGDALYAKLDKALVETNPAKAVAQYKSINNFIMQQVYGVPYVNSTPAIGLSRKVLGFVAGPTLTDYFDSVRLAK